jgi:hypothetical protein
MIVMKNRSLLLSSIVVLLRRNTSALDMDLGFSVSKKNVVDHVVDSFHYLERPLTAEDAIFEQELEWASRAMESYKQAHGYMPLRSSIRAAHVHTKDWEKDSMDTLRFATSESQDERLAEDPRNRRGRNLRRGTQK